MIATVLAFLLAMGLLVAIHEYGHYRMAIACGVKVLRFSVGFGRVIWRRQKNAASTEFVLCALPLGGYVRMLDEREGSVSPSDRSFAFNNRPLWQRAAVVAAGPAANLILALLLYAGANWIGTDEPKAILGAPPVASLADRAGLRVGDWVRATSTDGTEWEDVASMTDLRWRVSDAVTNGERLHLMLTSREGRGERVVVMPLDTLESRELDAALMRQIGFSQPFSEPVLGQVKPDGPAAKAGLQAGDRVLSVDGVTTADSSSLRESIRQSVKDAEPVAMEWRIERSGQALKVEVVPTVVFDEGQRIGRVEASIGKPPEMVKVHYGFFDGLATAATRTWDMSVMTLKLFGRMLIGEASLKNLSGPLTIADYAGQTARLGLAYYLSFLAVVSVSLGVLNLLPLPMLDGGHLMYYLFEAVTGRPVSELWLRRLQKGGIAILFTMMSLALFNDVARLLGLH